MYSDKNKNRILSSNENCYPQINTGSRYLLAVEPFMANVRLSVDEWTNFGDGECLLKHQTSALHSTGITLLLQLSVSHKDQVYILITKIDQN